MRRPGRPIAFAGIGTLAVLLMVGVALARWRTAGVWTPPVGRPAVPASAVADPTTVYLPEALSLRPRPLNPDLLRTAVEDLRARTDGPPGVTVRFVVLADGAVDPSSVSVSSEDSAGVQTLRSRLMAARFRPGSAWGHPVPVLVAFPVRWDRGQPVARLDDATWNVEMDPGQEVQAPVIESGGLALDKLDSRPELLNKTEVSQMLSRSYPPLLQEAGIGGKAVIQFVTARDGTVDPNSITIVSSTHEQFAQASARVVSMFRFRPGYYHGKPVRVQVRLPITWQPMP